MKHFFPTTILLLCFSFNLPAQVTDRNLRTSYEPGLVLFKLREIHHDLVLSDGRSTGSLQVLLNKTGGGELRKNFPASKPPGKKRLKNVQKPVDLSRIYELKLADRRLNIDSLCRIFIRSGLFEWVQPRYIQQPMFTPNDPQLGQQYHHNLIKSFEAWDISTGDTNVVIGITDAGIQFDHNDLKNVKYNFADPINGVDDDQDGYIDNFRGWNAVNQSNDPTATLSPHGIFTTGMSSATVNNNIGVAGLSYKCKYIPIRIDNASGFNYGYEGIVYAADMGCDIINASWGSTVNNPLGEEVVRYAQERNCLVVAAAGNSGNNEKYYPASFPGVMSVGASGPTDLKWSGSTFSHRVDLVAPGENVRSTWPFNGYDNSSGTSFSAPLVSGAAALVKSKFPGYTAEQLAERLRVTADTGIYQLPGNAAWYHLLGSGRLNVFRALNDPELPSVHFYKRSFSDNDGDQFAEAGDEISIHGVFKNFLAPTKNLQAVMSCSSPYVEMLDSAISAGIIGGGDSLSNSAFPFRFLIKPDAPYNLDLLLKITYKDTGYSAFEYIEFRVNKDYMDLDVNHIHTTITSRGNTGYAGDFGSDGSGFRFNDQQLIYYSGLMLGTSAQQTADNAYASSLPGFNNDFVRLTGVRSNFVPGDPKKEIESSFYTDSAATQRIEVKHRALAFAETGLEDQIILHYTLINQGNQAIQDLHAGIFTDFDIRNGDQNIAGYDPNQKLSYAFDTASGGTYAGIRQLSHQQAHGYAFNSNGAGASLNLYDGFSHAEKFQALSGNATRNLSQPGDIANLIGTNGINLAAGDSMQVSYAMLAAKSLQELKEKGREVQGYYNYSLLDVFQSVVPLSCEIPTGAVQLNFNTETIGLRLLNSDRVLLRSDSGALSSFAYQGLSSGNYFLRFEFADQTFWETQFELDTLLSVTVLAEANPAMTTLANPEVQFNASAVNAQNYSWDFGDGNTSSDQNPTHTYTDTGTYQVNLIASNAWCSDTIALEVIVGTTVGIERISSEIALFPVPASDFLYIRLPEGQYHLAYRVYSSSGLLIGSGNYNRETGIPIRELSAGIYLLQLQTASGKITKVFPVMQD